VKSDTVFGHLVRQFAISPENLATEALSFILRTSPAASSAFTNFVRQIVSDCPDGMRFETQQVGVEQSIPDMKCVDDVGSIRVIVENKFWAGLTENQPVTYIRDLPAGVSALVLFVVPEARLQIVWDEVLERCQKNEISVRDVRKLTTMITGGIGQGHYLAATSWTVLLDALSTAATLTGQIESRNDIAQLIGLCKTMEEEEFLPLRGDELTNLGMARRIITFSDLPFGIVKEAVNQGLCDRQGVREVALRYGSGSYVRIGEYTAWVGFHANQWQQLGVSPIWVNFYPDRCPVAEVRNHLRQFRNTSPPRCFDMETRDYKNYKWVAVPILLPVGVEKQRIIEDAVRQIRELRDELDVREPLPATLTPMPTDDLDTNPENPENVLEIGAEGGSLSVVRQRN